MGLLTVGQPLSWEETKKNAHKVRTNGIKQFINLYNLFKNRDFDCFKYGDEVEYSLVKFDHQTKNVYLLLKANELLKVLDSEHSKNENETQVACWSPEFGNFMIEGLPANPYEHEISDIRKIEENMKYRRKYIQSLLPNDEFIMTFSTFPLLGCRDFTYPNHLTTPGQGITSSVFFPDKAIFQGHPRYATSLINNRERRKSKSYVNIPIFIDKNTPQPFSEDFKQYGDSCDDYILTAKENHIYLDGFGGACACLQATFQARNLEEARQLYDALTPFTPILLALSAASPIWRGYLSEIDCRWKPISESLDDRTPEEKGEQPLKNDRFRIYKSRYDSVDCYLTQNGAKYNDINVVKDEEFYKVLLDNNVDELIAQHVAHLFIRDPLIVYKESLEEENHSLFDTDHFENIQSTNWQSMRFKPPPKYSCDSKVGWRVEFRTTEVQTTDFENAAFVTFLVILTRVLLSFNLDFLIPISKVDENMQRAQRRNACLKEKFYFKIPKDLNLSECTNTNEEIIQELSIKEIICGDKNKFVGIIPLFNKYLSEIQIDCMTFCKIKQYLKLIQDRACGNLKTTAAWMRDFVMKHPKYQFDSKVTNEIAYDLMWNLNQLSNGEISVLPDLVNFSGEY